MLRLTDGAILHRVSLGSPLRANPAAAAAPRNHLHSIQILFPNSKPLSCLMSFDQDSTPVINYGYGGRCVLIRYHHLSHQCRLSAWICKVQVFFSGNNFLPKNLKPDKTVHSLALKRLNHGTAVASFLPKFPLTNLFNSAAGHVSFT